MNATRCAIWVVLPILFAGCIGLPSGWKPFGTPLDRIEKRDAQESAARTQVLGSAQAAAHQTVLALRAAEPSRAVAVATDFAVEAQTLLDQSQGAPLAGDAAKWNDLVNRLLSENADIRRGAERDRAKDRESVAELADKLASTTAARVRAEQQVREYAKENERLADVIRKVVWIAGGLAAIWVLGQVLAVAARMNPALAGISGAVNMVAAPAVQFAASRAQSGLARVGEGMGRLRRIAGEKAEDLIERAFDGPLDADQKAIIARAAAKSP